LSGFAFDGVALDVIQAPKLEPRIMRYELSDFEWAASRVVKISGVIQMLEYVRPHGAVRRIVAKLWEPWIDWAYSASFDRRTEQYIPEAGLHLLESRFVADDLLKLISARVTASVARMSGAISGAGRNPACR
jgi:hypothetical protein